MSERLQPPHIPPHVEPPDPMDLARDARQREEEERADELSALKASNAILLAALSGLRGMAEIEAMNGSTAWKKAVLAIDLSIKDAKLHS